MRLKKSILVVGLSFLCTLVCVIVYQSLPSQSEQRTLASLNTDVTQLPAFNYKLSEIDRGQMLRAFKLLNEGDNSTRRSSVCANRAHFWSYDMYRRWDIQSGKIFIFYTNRLLSKKDEEWWYHVAPYVVADGKEYVMDAGFRGDFNRIPTIKEWIQYFAYEIKPLSAESTEYASGDYSRCKEIDPNTDQDLLEQMQYTRLLPNSKGRCYYFKAPMYYMFPVSLHDYFINKEPNYTSFEEEDVIEACKDSIPKLKFNFCFDYFGVNKQKFKKERRKERREEREKEREERRRRRRS